MDLAAVIFVQIAAVYLLHWVGLLRFSSDFMSFHTSAGEPLEALFSGCPSAIFITDNTGGHTSD